MLFHGADKSSRSLAGEGQDHVVIRRSSSSWCWKPKLMRFPLPSESESLHWAFMVDSDGSRRAKKNLREGDRKRKRGHALDILLRPWRRVSRDVGNPDVDEEGDPCELILLEVARELGRDSMQKSAVEADMLAELGVAKST
mmetsp:Transcript_44402/g.140129  ORF Transcript_44402/g.140129 Transcript_44402/m.140129 type:complete len:141 (-) Transcript_44402:900-1322(-)